MTAVVQVLFLAGVGAELDFPPRRWVKATREVVVSHHFDFEIKTVETAEEHGVEWRHALPARVARAQQIRDA